MDIKPITNKIFWDSWVQRQKYTSLFLSWNWGIFERRMGNIFENYGLFKGGSLVGVLPIKFVVAKRGKYLHLRHGPVLDWDNTDPDSVCKSLALVESFVRNKARLLGAWFIRISPLVPKNSVAEQCFFKRGFINSATHNRDAELAWVLPLDKPEAELLQGMRKSTRYGIRKAQREGVEIIKTKSTELFGEFWRIYRKTVDRQKWTGYSRKYIETQFQVFAQDNQALMFLARYKGEYISAAIFIYYGGQSIYHHAGSLTRYRKVPASYLLQWEAINEAKRRGMKVHNFWGISPQDKPNHPWAGLSFFKRGFGGHAQEFAHAKDLKINWLYYATRAFEKIECWQKGY